MRSARLVPAPAAEWFAYRYGVAEGGNVANDPHTEFAGRNILYQAATVEETAEQFGASGRGGPRRAASGRGRAAGGPRAAACARTWTIRS